MKSQPEKIQKKKIKFSGYGFDDLKMRKRMKYLVVFKGDLDLNGCCAFEDRKHLQEYLKEPYKEIQAIFEITRNIEQIKINNI